MNPSLVLFLFLTICATTRSAESPSMHPPRKDLAARAAGPPIIRYTSSQMTSELFTSHLSSGLPFVVNLPNPSTAKIPTTLDEWSASFSKTWNHSEPMMWNGRLPRELRHDFEEWEKAGNKVSFDTFKWARERWPLSYLSIAANIDKEESQLSKLFAAPFFISDDQYRQGMWMYGGEKGSGVADHTDSIHCVCSWAYMLFGTKKWFIGSPPHSNPEVLYQPLLQEKGDFFFWCVGWIHGTEILSDESLDVHGYVKLEKSETPTLPPAKYNSELLFSEKLAHYASNCLANPLENKESCNTSMILGDFCRREETPTPKIHAKSVRKKFLKLDDFITSFPMFEEYEYYYLGLLYIPFTMIFLLFWHIKNYFFLVYVPVGLLFVVWNWLFKKPARVRRKSRGQLPSRIEKNPIAEKEKTT